MVCGFGVSFGMYVLFSDPLSLKKSSAATVPAPDRPRLGQKNVDRNNAAGEKLWLNANATLEFASDRIGFFSNLGISPDAIVRDIRDPVFGDATLGIKG